MICDTKSACADCFPADEEAALTQGNFILIIVVDEISEELARILNYISVCGRPKFDFAALEMRRFSKDETEILVPHVLGPAKAEPAEPARLWDKPSFYKELDIRHGQEVGQVARRILDWAESKTRVKWGVGGKRGSFTPIIDHKERQYYLLAVWNTSGSVENYLYQNKERPPFDSDEKRMEWLDRLNRIDGVEFSKENINKQPTISLQNLMSDKALEQFLSTYDWVVEEILKS